MGRKNSFFSLKNTSLRTDKGMTLSEVLVITAILGILIISVAFFIRPTFQIGKAKDAERKSDLNKLATALEDYSTDHGCYPLVDSNWETALAPYLKQVPKDPQTNQSYAYTAPSGQECKENGVTVGVKKFAIFTTLRSEAGISYEQGNYAVTSPNYSLFSYGSCGESSYYGCFSGECRPLCRDCNALQGTPLECCRPNYQTGPGCGGPSVCSNPGNECDYE